MQKSQTNQRSLSVLMYVNFMVAGLLGYPAALGYHGLGLPVVAAPAAAAAEE